MGLWKKIVEAAAKGLGYSFGYYMMKKLIDKSSDPVKRAEWKRNIKKIKGKFRIRKVERA